MPMLTVPCNENGIILDATTLSTSDTPLTETIKSAIDATPFGFEDVYLFSHGWSTNADQTMIGYDIFSIGLMRCLLITPPPASPPRSTLELGIHWPSEITEDPNSDLNKLQLFTFYTMEHRADQVGRNLVYSMLRLVLANRAKQALRLFLVGHSFGCKAICAALQDLYTDIQNDTIPISDGTTWKVALIQAATDNDNLEAADIYGNVAKLKNLRLLLTTSAQDLALNVWYPVAGKLANLFHGAPEALGAVGPTGTTVSDFGGIDELEVNPGLSMPQARGTTKRLVHANLSPVHLYRKDNGLYSGGFAGSHSDIYFEEVYNLIGGFFYSSADGAT